MDYEGIDENYFEHSDCIDQMAENKYVVSFVESTYKKCLREE